MIREGCLAQRRADSTATTIVGDIDTAEFVALGIGWLYFLTWHDITNAHQLFSTAAGFDGLVQIFLLCETLELLDCPRPEMLGEIFLVKFKNGFNPRFVSNADNERSHRCTTHAWRFYRCGDGWSIRRAASRSYLAGRLAKAGSLARLRSATARCLSHANTCFRIAGWGAFAPVLQRIIVVRLVPK